ncbi:Ldh family oxidoreductase [Oceanomicrobium pacificus]|uniref:Ldh family oxidoreductase n=1 Tax=Oceanomicrobium pacificus TaxID=2692916 RepID=A0A6B0TSJ9_9RHOB|nr:Ldh family oxidoreductase [Oceanomicrobium pacificus]MXU64775.1 Ldh family oxidoreductase [Oceanomicrobium pacificus]
MDTETIFPDEGRALIARTLVAHDVSPANAARVAQALVQAEAEGLSGHGFARVAAYAAQARAGKVRGQATPAVTRPRPGTICVDAGLGFAYPALDAAHDPLVSAARELGIACAAIVNSHHCGALGQPVERLAEAGLIGLMMANAPASMPPWGGSEPLFGTNPIAFAAPRHNGAPLVIDLSLSKVARGKIMAAAKLGKPIPEGWAVDRDGRPTTDAKAALDGAMLPAGGAKGAALALMVEIFAGALAGPHFSYQAASFFDAEGPAPAVGQFLIAIDPGASRPEALDRITALFAEIDAQDGARLPGRRRQDGRTDADRNGLQVPRALLDEIRRMAG